MKKNFSINLFGTLYNIDEDAYNLLESYLRSMQRHFRRQDGGAEIADDIEHRVAELLWQRREAGMTAVDIEVVKDIIGTIGDAQQIAGNEASEGQGTADIKEDFKRFAEDAGRFARDTYDKGKQHVRTHRFYRSASDKVLGGVCSGLSIYFNAGEPVIWRLAAVLLTLLGIGLPLPIVYLVIWLVTPAALTPEDRLRQKGKDITPDNLAQQVSDDAEPVVVGSENKGCLKAILIVLAVCVVLPVLVFFGIWIKMMWSIVFDTIF